MLNSFLTELHSPESNILETGLLKDRYRGYRITDRLLLHLILLSFVSCVLMLFFLINLSGYGFRLLYIILHVLTSDSKFDDVSLFTATDQQGPEVFNWVH